MLIKDRVKLLLEEKQAEESMFNNIIRLCLGGSHVSKTNDNTSDIDCRAIVVLDENHQIGLKAFDHVKYTTGSEGINQFSDLDVEIFHFDSYINRLYKGEIVAIETLIVDKSFIMIEKDIMKPIIDNVEVFFSKQIALNYFGGLKSYINKMSVPIGNLRRKDKIQRATKYGYETKDAMKAIMYMELVIEFLKHGTLTLVRPNHEELLRIKNGKYSLEEIRKVISELDQEKEYWIKATNLPDKPDYEKVNQFKKDYTKQVYKDLGIRI